MLVMSSFSFSHSVFKRLVVQTGKNQDLFGKGLCCLAVELAFVATSVIMLGRAIAPLALIYRQWRMKIQPVGQNGL